MKLLIATCLKEDQEKVAKIFEQAKITVFSVSNTNGFKGNNYNNLLDSWFAAGSNSFDSLFLFSFTAEENADQAIELIKNDNNTTKSDFPIRAFIVPVEKSSY
jgi:hypothetical protein